MKNLFQILFIFLIGSTLVACSGPVEQAKEENEEKFGETVLEDDAKFAVDFANYFMFTQALSNIIAERSDAERLREFAKTLSNDHQQLNSQLVSIANAANIELPTSMSPEYQEFLKGLEEEEEIDEINEAYLEKIIAMHKTFNKKAEEKIAGTEYSEFLDFARNVSSQQYVHQNTAENLLELMES